jgi:glycosyltransferase involved in cell wall biosynthesis
MPGEITVIIPAYNEANSIGAVIDGVKALGSDLIHEIIVVDDGSRDDTARVAKEHGARVIEHDHNMGYGASLKAGIREATTEYVLTMDADGQHCAADIPRLHALIQNNDMVVGERQGFMHSQPWRMPGKWLLSLMANYLSRRVIPDLNSGLRIVRRKTILKYLHLCPAGFSFSTTITMTLLNRGYRVSYVPITVNKRTSKSTVSIATGLDTIVLILRIATLFDPLRIFVPASMISGAAGVCWGIPYALGGRGISVGSMLAIVTAILLFGLGLLCDQISQLRLERYE